MMEFYQTKLNESIMFLHLKKKSVLLLFWRVIFKRNEMKFQQFLLSVCYGSCPSFYRGFYSSVYPLLITVLLERENIESSPR